MSQVGFQPGVVGVTAYEDCESTALTTLTALTALTTQPRHSHFRRPQYFFHENFLGLSLHATSGE